MREEVISRVEKEKLIAIIRGCDTKSCLRLSEALHAGGINLMEVTFQQNQPETFAATAASIRAICDEFKGEVLAGAGTVLTPEQVDMAAEAGASYIISPNTDTDVIRHTVERGLVSMPGAFTASEIIAAHKAGADFVKVFPIGNLGPAYMKALKAPISHIRLLAVGGVNEKNIGEFMKAGAAGAGVGGNLVNKKWIADGEFDKITKLAQEFVENVNQ